MRRRLLLLLLAGSVAYAQESRGTIAGVVMDAQSAGIPKARVVITNIDTGVDTVLQTNERGAYVAPLLIPGNYRVAAEHEGFKKFTRDGITLSVNDNLRIDIQLDVGTVTETVNVTAAAPLVESTTGNIGMLVGNQEVTELPLAHGNPYALIALAPGTTFEGNPLLDRPYEPTHIVAYSMSGTPANSTDITLDGVSNTSRSGAGQIAAGYVPPPDAIGEMRIETSSFDARAGQTSGGLVNISLRSGTNKLRGSFNFTKMKPEWMANTWFGNRNGIPRGDFDYNRWSASASGPVALPKLYNGRNRTFFMWAYDALSDQRPPQSGSATLTVPTPAQRKGDFSELLALGANYQIYDPATRRREAGSTTRYRQDPFPNNIIPAQRFNPVAVKMMDYFALPLNEGTTADHRNNYPQPNTPEVAEYFTHTVRVDHNFNSSNRLYVRGNGYVRDSYLEDYFKTRATGRRTQYHPIGGAVDHVFTWSPTLVLNVRYGYTRFTRQQDPLRGRYFDLTSLGFPASFAGRISPDKSEFPALEIRDYFNTQRTGEARFMDTHSLVAAFTKLRGGHTFDFGFEARAYRHNQYTGDSSRSGRFIFDQTWTRGPLDNSPVSPIGQGWASFLLGLFNASGYLARPADFAEQSTVWCGYFQDNWRVRRNLTINIGFRYELEGPLTERYDRSISGFDANAALPIEAAAKTAYAASWPQHRTAELLPDQFKVRGGLVFAATGGRPRGLWKRDINNLAPRVAIAYTVTRRTVLRAGYGIFFGPLGMRRTDVLQNGFSRNTPLVPTKDSGLTFYSTLSNPFPDGILEPVGKALGPMTDVGSNTIRYFHPEPKAYYNQRWQFSVQRQFGSSSMVEAAYVGNRSTKTEITRDLNVVGNQMLSRSPVFDQERVNYLTANIPNPFRGLDGVAGTLGTGANISRENLLKPFPQFSAVNTGFFQGYSWYHSLQTRAARRVSSRISLNASFTWSKNMVANNFLNPGDDLPYESLSGADRPFRVTGSALYQMPFGQRGALLRTVPRWVDAGIGGWQVSAMYVYQSGVPLAWQDVIFDGNPDDIRKGPRSVQRWFNIDAGFARDSRLRPSYHYRTWPFYLSGLRRHAQNNVDLSVNKRFRLSERGVEFQIRGDALNAFNHPLFGAPNMDQFSTAFGQITATANYPRQIQFVFRLSF